MVEHIAFLVSMESRLTKWWSMLLKCYGGNFGTRLPSAQGTPNLEARLDERVKVGSRPILPQLKVVGKAVPENGPSPRLAEGSAGASRALPYISLELVAEAFELESE